jgi:rhodanese-related sulfurtransferase
MIPWEEPFIFIGSEDEVREAALRLHRIGYDHPAGYLAGGTEAWQAAGRPVQPVAQVPPLQLHESIREGTAPILVDVRLPAEWMALRISDTLLNIPVNKLAAESGRLDPSMPVLTVCNSAYRSIMAASILQKEGFKDVLNMDGGGEAWIEAGLPTFGGGQAAAVQPGVYVNLPERMSPRDLAQRLTDLPGTIDVVDIRPAWQFAEFAIAGSVNVPVQNVMSSPAYLNDRRPLVLVCRDGGVSASVAGALVQKSQRPIRFLAGGAQRYYDEIMRPGGILDTPVMLPQEGNTQPPAAPAAAVPGPPSAPPPVELPKPRKRSAGC